MRETFDVIVVGGGAIGMTSAWRLAQTGRRVLLLDRGPLGAEASSAAAGMLGAQLEVSEPGAFYQLCLESRALYPQFAEELFEETGIDVQLTHNGIYQLAFSEEEVAALKRRMAWQVRGGGRAEFLTSEQVMRNEPALAASHGALLLPDDGNIHAPFLTRALAKAVQRRCTVVEGAEVIDVESQGSSGYIVRTQGATYAGASVLVAAGAWAKRLLPSLACDIQPVKGQLLSIRPRHGNGLVHTVFTHHAYFVPKRDGTIVVGATEDSAAGYDREVTIDAMQTLLTAVHKVAPGLCDAIFERTWTGLRPGSSNNEPRIGELSDAPGLHVAVGHFRNGILLAPLTAKMIVASLEGQSWPDHWAMFQAQPAKLAETR